MRIRALVPLLTGLLGCAAGLAIGLQLQSRPVAAPVETRSPDTARRNTPRAMPPQAEPSGQASRRETDPYERHRARSAETDPFAQGTVEDGEPVSPWTNEEAVAAAVRASSLPEGAEKFKALNAVISFAMQRYGTTADAAPLLAVLDQQTADIIRVSLLSKVEPDPFSNEPNSGLHASAAEIARILHSHAGKTDYLERLGGEAGKVARCLAEESPSAGIEWVMALPPEARMQGLQAAVVVWARKDAVGASEWISRLESGLFREASAMCLIRELEYADPERALAWATSLADTHQAQSVRKSIFQKWIQMDTEAAFSALQQLPVAERKFILSRSAERKSH